MPGKKVKWIIGISLATLLLVAGGSQVFFLLRYPYFREYARINGVNLSQAREAWGHPNEISEVAMGLAVEASRENWEAVARIAAVDRKSEVGTYYYNLANAMNGQLADRLMDYYQPFERGLFLPVGEKSQPFVIACASDVWFALGEMAMAERDAMLGMLFSPAHNGSRYLKRLAETNLVTGNYEAASKYLRMLANSRADRKWALERFPEDNWSPEFRERIERKRALLPRFDLVHGMDQTQLTLRVLLNSNPSNKMALDYLLCFDLLTKDLDAFVADYAPSLTSSHLYEEAMLVFLAAKGGMNEENFQHYNIRQETLERFSRFVSIYQRDNGSSKNIVGEFGKTYWYYFYYAARKEKD